jgi:hypothetical protein
MTPHELRKCLRALRALRGEAAASAQEQADVLEHIVMWDFLCLAARGHGRHAALARDILESLAQLGAETPRQLQ